MNLMKFSDSTKALLDSAHIGVQTTTHVAGTAIKISGTWDEVEILDLNQDAKEIEAVALPTLKT